VGGRVDKEEGAAARAACASMPEVDDEGGIAGRGRARCAGVGGRARTALTRTTHADDEKRVSLSSPVCAHSLLSRLKRARTHARTLAHALFLSLSHLGWLPPAAASPPAWAPASSGSTRRSGTR